MKVFHSRRGFNATDGVTRVIQHIDEKLAEGSLIANQRLVETELSSDLNVGRAQVREAIRLLAGDGVIELIPNTGARVRPVTRKRLVEMLKVSNALIGAAIEDHLEQENISASMKRLKRITASATDLQAKKALDLLLILESYINEIIDGSNNSYISEAFHRIHWSHYNRPLALAIPHGVLVESIQHFKQLSAALEQKDSHAAQKVFDLAKRKLFSRIGQLD